MTHLQEMEFEAIQPTRTYRDEERSARVGGVDTQVVEQIPYTVYNVEKITARVTNTPTVAVGNLGLEALSDPGQLGALLQVSSSSNYLRLKHLLPQNVLLSILGGGLLGAGGPTVHQGPQKTELITHTRSFLTTITSLETIKIPVNFRGSTIFQTVTDEKTNLVTVTDYSVQTVLNYQSQSQPFLPLAPTLHRAARVVPASPPPLNILPILHTSPPHLQTSLLTQTETVTTLATSQILLTLGGRAITTEIVEPVTQVIQPLIGLVSSVSSRSHPLCVCQCIFCPAGNTFLPGGDLNGALHPIGRGGRGAESHFSNKEPEATAVAAGHPWTQEIVKRINSMAFHSLKS